MTEEHSLLSNPMLWYSASVVVFVLLAVKMGRKPILGFLDAEIAKVRAELDNARALKAEAEATLESYREKQKQALAEAEQIVASAKADASRLRADAEIELKKTIERHEQKALQRIETAEKAAMDEVRAVIVNQAVEEARKAFAKRIDDKLLDQMAAGSVADVVAVSSAVKGRVA